MPEPVSDYQRKLERRAARERGEFVGFVACSYGPRRLLKVALPDQRKRVRVRCPVEGCPEGEHETPNAMPRARDRGEVCDVGVDGADPGSPDADPPADDDANAQLAELARERGLIDAAPKPPKPRPPRRSDWEVIAAVPTETTPAVEVAEALGYGDTVAVVRRLERLNARAVAAGEAAPFVVARAGHGRPTMIRRRATRECVPS